LNVPKTRSDGLAKTRRCALATLLATLPAGLLQKLLVLLLAHALAALLDERAHVGQATYITHRNVAEIASVDG